MPNFAAVLKTEIARLARRSIRPLIVPLKRDVAALKRAMAELKRLVARLTKDNARVVADLNSRIAAPARASEDEVRQARLSPRLIRAQRKRLGLSRDAFAKLVGVTGGAVLAWEGGRSKPRSAAKSAIVAVRKLGKRAARQRLEVIVRANGGIKRIGARGRRARSRQRQ